MNGGQGFRAQPQKLAPCGSVSSEGPGKLVLLPFRPFCTGFPALSATFCLVFRVFLDAWRWKGKRSFCSGRGAVRGRALRAFPSSEHVQKGRAAPLCSRDRNDPPVGFGGRQGAGAPWPRTGAAPLSLVTHPHATHHALGHPSSLPPSRRFICSLSIMYLPLCIPFTHSSCIFILINQPIHPSVHPSPTNPAFMLYLTIYSQCHPNTLVPLR